jgi:hypothetical protein
MKHVMTRWVLLAGLVASGCATFHDAAAIVGYASTASEAALTAVARFDPVQAVAQLIARRPFTTLQRSSRATASDRRRSARCAMPRPQRRDGTAVVTHVTGAIRHAGPTHGEPAGFPRRTSPAGKPPTSA